MCHLTGTSGPLDALFEKSRKEWIDYPNNHSADEEAVRPSTRLMSLPNLLKAIRKKGSGARSNGNAVKISDSELEWLERFHVEFRNQFTHFKPMGWAIEVSGIPEIARIISRIITDIHNNGWAFRHLEDLAKTNMVADLERLRKAEW